MSEPYKYPCPFRLHYRCKHTRVVLLAKEDFDRVPHSICGRCGMSIEPDAASNIALTKAGE